MRSKISIFVFLALAIIGTIFVSGCVQRETGQEISITTTQPPISPTQAPKQVQKTEEISAIVQQANIPDIQKPLPKAIAVSRPKEDIIPNELAEFFDQFDFDNSGQLDIEEAAEFYYWVEDNIKYRCDDENDVELCPDPTYRGDGRPGVDYRQRPYETWKEGTGDCEDMATLQAAFLNHWGIAAYVAGVNAETPDVIDHAVTIALIEDNPDDFADLLGELVYWEFKEGDEVIAYDVQEFPSGFYMLVDNAYSDAFGYLTGGLQQNQFSIYCIAPVESPYDADWDDFVGQCGYEWTS